MVASYSPKVNSIVWQGNFKDPALNAILRFPALENLRISSKKTTEMSGKIFHRLSQIHNLKSLTVHLGRNVTPDKFVHSPSVVTFHSLQTLELEGPSNAILHVLNDLSLSTLSSLGVIFTSTSPGDLSPEKCLSTIEEKGAIKTLRSIRIVADDYASVIGRTQIQGHLKKYGPQLEHIDVESVSVLKDALEDLCQSIFAPNLKTLEYVTQRPSRLDRHIQLSDLQLIADKMTNLQTLHFPVSLDLDDQVIELLQDTLENVERKCHGLQDIVLRPVGVDDPGYDASTMDDQDMFSAFHALTVGNYLNYLFPHLNSVDLSNFSEIDAGWRETVEDVVKALQKERWRVDERGLCCKTCTNFPKDF
ncbi:hypothetical protein D9613_007118 [Agrocybe pediades]|uniref:Uncharacterized protein n=1 Tax=Agrocybe pediades TaxID=84607 RepID=A0A8H4QHF6_9AGAR|nr:hypothetical protein D9613_007118 [Agrocybe pediades]